MNNCGKRVLIEQLYPTLNSNANYDVVLVGHIDSSEVPKSRSSKLRHLDRDRVLQVAAVLSGGGGTCTTLDTSRIKGVWVSSHARDRSSSRPPAPFRPLLPRSARAPTWTPTKPRIGG